MSSARRKPFYSVQDVIDAVQNGESDVDIDFDETDEESDDETHEEVDKENHPPTDCPADEDIEPQPAKHAMPRDRYRWQKKVFISPNTDFSGPPLTKDMHSLHTPLEYFRQFVSEDMIESLTINTIEYSLQTHGRSINTNKKEIEQMMGMYLKMGLVQMAGKRMYAHGRLLDATKNYMFVFLLAGSEVVLSAVVLATCNFLFIRTKSSTPADKLENITVTDEAKTDVVIKPAEAHDEEEKGAREEQEREKEVMENLKEERVTDKEKAEEVKLESLTVDSQEVERFLKEPQQNGAMATSPETCL